MTSLSQTKDPETAVDEAVTGTTLCLVRHGETDWNVALRYQGNTDIPLNATGLHQADLVADVVAAEPWDAIVSSPLSRAYSTAEAIARATGLSPIHTDPDLQERAYGAAEGMTHAERESHWSGDDWPGKEDPDAFQERAMAALARIVERFPGQRVIVTSHGGVINAVLHDISGGEIGTGITKIPNTSLTTVVKTTDEWRVIRFAIADHLEIAMPAGG